MLTGLHLFVLEGGTLQGFISDMLQKRAPVLALSLLLAIGSLVGYSREYFLAAKLFASSLRTKAFTCLESVISPGEVVETRHQGINGIFVLSCEQW